MRMTRIAAAAGLFVAALGISTAADARPHDGWRDGYHDVRGRDGWRDGRHDNGRHLGWYKHDRRWRDGRGWHRPRCWTEWRHHHRVRVCR